MMKYASKFMNYIDFFGLPIQLQVKKKPEYHTLLGSISSLLIIIFILYSFLSLMIDLFAREQPNVLSKTIYDEDPTPIDISPDQYLFAVTLANEFAIPIVQQQDKLLYVAQASPCIRNQTPSGVFSSDCSTVFNMKPCSTLQMTSIATVRYPQYKEMNFTNPLVLQTSYCIDPEEWKQKQIQLQGTASSSTFQSFVVRVMKCNSTLAEAVNGSSIKLQNIYLACASKEEIESTLDRGYAALFIPDRLLDQKQQGNPFKPITKSISTTITSSQYKSMTIIMRKSILFNQENFFYYFQSEQSYETLQYQQQTEYVEYTPRDDIFYSVFYMDDKQMTYYRTYNNILEILGQIGGLLELVQVLIKIIINPINNLSVDLYLAQSIYQFDKSIKKKQISPINDQQTGFQGLIRQIKQRKKQHINGLNYIISQKEIKESLEYSINQIYMKLDVVYLINKIIEIDKLKKIFLTQDQQNLFNYIHKPIIKSNNSMKRSQHSNLYDHTNLSPEEELQNAYQSYKLLQQTRDPLNQNIINLMDKEVKDIFNQQEVHNSSIIKDNEDDIEQILQI